MVYWDESLFFTLGYLVPTPTLAFQLVLILPSTPINTA